MNGREESQDLSVTTDGLMRVECGWKRWSHDLSVTTDGLMRVECGWKRWSQDLSVTTDESGMWMEEMEPRLECDD